MIVGEKIEKIENKQEDYEKRLSELESKQTRTEKRLHDLEYALSWVRTEVNHAYDTIYHIREAVNKM